MPSIPTRLPAALHKCSLSKNCSQSGDWRFSNIRLRRRRVPPQPSRWTLRISPCRFEGSYVTNDIVICGEGYARHFGSIGSLGIRDEVRLQTVDGVLYRYVVSNVETDRMEDITAIMDDWDLTLFTFNADGSCCVVRCVRVT